MKRARRFSTVFFLAAALAYAAVPRLISVAPDAGKPGDELVASGQNLDSSNVTKLFLTAGGKDFVQQSLRGLRSGGRGPDVLIHPEQVRRVVLVLDSDEPLVVVTVSCLDPFLSLVHHEVHVGSASRVGMQRIPIILCPRDDAVIVGWVGVHADDHLRPIRITISPGGVTAGDAVGSPVDRVHMHR